MLRLNKKGAAWPWELLAIILVILIVAIAVMIAFNLNWRKITSSLEAAFGSVSEGTMKDIFTPEQLKIYLEKNPGEIGVYGAAAKNAFSEATTIEDYERFINKYCKGFTQDQISAHGLCDDAYYKLGEKYYEEMDNLPKALEYYKAAVAYPDFDVVSRRIAEDKIKELEAQIGGAPPGQIPGEERKDYRAAVQYLSNKHYDKAMEIFDSITKDPQADSSLIVASKYWIAKIYLENNQETNAFTLFNEIKKDHKTVRFPVIKGVTGVRDGFIVAWVYYEEGKYYEKKRDYNKAYVNYNKVLVDYYDEQVGDGKVGSYVVDQIKTDFAPKCDSITALSVCNRVNDWIDEEKIAQNDPELVYSLKCWSKDESERLGRIEAGGKRLYEGKYSCNLCMDIEPKICEGYERSHDTCELDPCHFVDGTTKKCGWSVSLAGRLVRFAAFDVGTCATMTETAGVWEFLREGWWKE